MPTKTKLGAAALLAGALLAGQAEAQQAAPAPQGAAPGQPPQAAQVDPTKPVVIPMVGVPQTDWIKVCSPTAPGQKETCFTTRDFTPDPKAPPPIALAIYDTKGEESRVVRVLMPLLLLIKPGVRLSVDKGAAIEGAFQLCTANGCFAEAKISAKQLEQMKKGTTMNVVAKGPANNEVTFALPLADFGKVFDGAPIPIAELQKRQQAQEADLQKQLQERALAQRQALEKAAGTSAPAATPPAGAQAPAAKP